MELGLTSFAETHPDPTTGDPISHGERLRNVVAEIERYFVMPGQATAYKVGMMKIMELRALAESELGEQFDIREFHDVVLNNGSMPLDILEELVLDYIAESKG